MKLIIPTHYFELFFTKIEESTLNHEMQSRGSGVYELTTNCKPQNVASKSRTSISDHLGIWLGSDHYTCDHEENVKLIEKYFSHFIVHFRYAKP
jgi:predicted AAA+ superfamily ATPase